MALAATAGWEVAEGANVADFGWITFDEAAVRLGDRLNCCVPDLGNRDGCCVTGECCSRSDLICCLVSVSPGSRHLAQSSGCHGVIGDAVMG